VCEQHPALTAMRCHVTPPFACHQVLLLWCDSASERKLLRVFPRRGQLGLQQGLAMLDPQM